MAAIGLIYNKSNFTDLTDFDVKGNWEISNGKLTTIGADSFLQYRYASALDNFTWKVRTNSPALKIQLYGIGANHIQSTFSINNGFAKWDYFNGNTSSGQSSGSLLIGTNDILEYSFYKSQWTYIFKVKNITKGTEIQVNPNIGIVANKLRIWSATPLEVTSIVKSSDQEFEPLNLLVGDSISAGAVADIATNGWGYLSGFDIEASPSDTSVEALQLVNEITNIIKPKRVIYAMGTNDINIEVWKTNLNSFKQMMDQKHIVFIPISPYANNIRNMQAYKDFIASNFDTYFDLFFATKQDANSNMKAAYNSGDGIHPNTFGHKAISEYVLASPYYVFQPYVPPINTPFYIPIIQEWFS